MDRSEARIPALGRCPYRVGAEYSGRGLGVKGRVRIMATVKDRFDGGEAEASLRRQGFKDADAFREWCLVQFGAYEPAAQAWVIVFVPATDPVRLLARSPRTTKAHGAESHGYTNDPRVALEDEPEAVPEDVQAEITAAAEAKEDRRRATMRSRLAQMRQAGVEQIKAGKDPTPILDEALSQMQGS
jgi:hypothetical protein